MTKIDEFIDFASGLNAEDRKLVETQLDLIMQTYQKKSLLTPEQEREVLAILADKTRKFADKAKVEAIYGVSLSRSKY